MNISRESALHCLKVFRHLGEPDYGRPFEISMTKYSLQCVNTAVISTHIALDEQASAAYSRLLLDFATKR